MRQQVVIYSLRDTATRIVIATAHDTKDARRIMKLFCSGKGWTMERRPDLHTWDDVVITFENED